MTTLTLSTPAALAALPQHLRLGARPTRLALALPGLDPVIRAQAEARLARSLSACGCNEGALALIAALPPAALWAFATQSGLAAWGWLLALVATASALGKFLGLARARRNLRREVDRVLRLAETNSH